MTHVVDTSAWSKYATHSAVRAAIDGLKQSGALFTTCPPVVAEFCYSARSPQHLLELQRTMSMLLQVKAPRLATLVPRIQTALWAHGLGRAAGTIDVLIAAYAIDAKQTVLTCDADFVHVSRALAASGDAEPLHYIYVAEDGTIASDLL